VLALRCLDAGGRCFDDEFMVNEVAVVLAQRKVAFYLRPYSGMLTISLKPLPVLNRNEPS